MIDLHIHTIASDGQHSAREIVRMSADMGLTAIAIADHNTVESVAEGEAAASEKGINFSPCIELDTVFRGRDLHVLGYFIAYDSEPCKAYLDKVYQAKVKQTELRVARLKELGFIIDFAELMELSNWRLPTGKQYITAMRDHEDNFSNPDFLEYIDGGRSDSPYLNFYLDWLRAGRPAFVPLELQPTERAIKEICKLGGVSILAHPSDTPEDDVHALIDLGLMGLEVFSSYHDHETTERFRSLARDREVLITAGSDFHGKEVKPEVRLGGIPGNEDRLFDELKKAAESV